MEHQNNHNDSKNDKMLELEIKVALGLWIQVIGQIIELKSLTDLFHLEDTINSSGEQQILTGVWIRTIGQILEAIAVSSQIFEKDVIKRLQEQKIAVTGDLLVAIGAIYEVVGGIHVLEEEQFKAPTIVP